MAIEDNNDDNGLYLVVGGLLLVALVFGFAYWGRYNNPANIEPAAGSATYSTTTTTTPAPSATDQSGSTTTTTNTNNTAPAPATNTP